MEALDFEMAQGLFLTRQARKNAYLTGHIEVGISHLCEAGLEIPN